PSDPPCRRRLRRKAWCPGPTRRPEPNRLARTLIQAATSACDPCAPQSRLSAIGQLRSKADLPVVSLGAQSVDLQRRSREIGAVRAQAHQPVSIPLTAAGLPDG